MPLTEAEELELLELEEAEAQSSSGPIRPRSEEAIRSEYPSEKFAKYAEPISQFGGMFARKALAGIGLAGAATAGTEAVRQGIQYLGNEPGTPDTLTESAKRIGTAGVRGALGEVAGRGIFKGVGMMAEKAAPTAITATSQMARGLAGVPQETAHKALTTDVLSTGLPKEEAQKIFGDFIESTGYKYGPESVKAATGKYALNVNQADDFIVDTLNKVDRFKGTTESGMTPDEVMVNRWQQRSNFQPEGPVNIKDLPENEEALKQLTQEALTARYAIGPAIKKYVKAGDDNMVRVLTKGRNMVDDWLETRIPGFSGVRKIYSDMETKEAFNSVFPRNKNLSPDAMRMMTAGIGGGAALATGNLLPAAGVLAMSPKAWEYGIRGSKAIAPAVKGVSKLGTRLGTQAGANYLLPSSYTTDQIRKKYMEGRK